MPNHVINIIKHKENDESTDFDEIKQAVKGEDSAFDFNRLITMPEHSETFFAKGGLGQEEREKYGENNWYDWAIENWGTKWNAYSIRANKYDTFVFQTAWAHPEPIIKKLSEIFPNDTFIVGYADEDIGNNTDYYAIKNGDQIDDYEESEILAELFWAADTEYDE